MTAHTYAGHTLAEIKEAAASITRWPIDVAITGIEARYGSVSNPSTVLAMAARIEELEKDAARLSAISELSSILREAVAILSGEAEMRYPIVDELQGFAAMLEEKPTTL